LTTISSGTYFGRFSGVGLGAAISGAAKYKNKKSSHIFERFLFIARLLVKPPTLIGILIMNSLTGILA